LSDQLTSLGSLSGDAIVFRRIGYWQYDYEKQKIFASAFKNDDEDGQSSCRHSVNWKEFSSIKKTLEGHGDQFGLAEITVQAYLDDNQTVKHSPKEGNYAHCDAIGKKSASVKKRLRSKARLLIPPPRPPVEHD
jgi:hypothetical protein